MINVEATTFGLVEIIFESRLYLYFCCKVITYNIDRQEINISRKLFKIIISFEVAAIDIWKSFLELLPRDPVRLKISFNTNPGLDA